MSDEPVRDSHIFKPTFTLEPGDGTGSSIQDAMVRNSKGLCGIRDCGLPVAPGAKTFMVGQLCRAHQESFRAWVDQVTKEAVNEN